MESTYLFDDNRWYSWHPEAYAQFLDGVVTDLIIVVYTRYGLQGCESDNMPSAAYAPTDALDKLIGPMSERNINVHLAFNVCVASPKYKSYDGVSMFTDVHDTVFQGEISDLMVELSVNVQGICLDFIRTDDFSDVDRNTESIANIARMTYEKADCILSSATLPYLDMSNNYYRQSGRRAIEWANAGYHDLLLDMNYGMTDGGNMGDPPNMQYVYKAREMTDKPVIVMVSDYIHIDRKPVSSPPSTFKKVIGTTYAEEDLAVYAGQLLSKENSLQIQYRDNFGICIGDA